jgi:hypothetical protein
MAAIQLYDGKLQPVSGEQARAVWECLDGKAPMTTAQAAYCRRVKRVYLNWREAPDSYVEKHIRQLLPAVLGEWCVDSQNRPVKPATEEAWRFARRWGLWSSNGPSMLVTGRQVALPY